jgi:hypothetical protein
MRTNSRVGRWVFLALLLSVALIIGLSRKLRYSSATVEPFPGDAQAPIVSFPLKPGSVRFAVIGDNGTGDSYEYDVAQQMVRERASFPFDFVVMLGDNIYGGHSSKDFALKFERPYHSLLESGVKFYASLGNHDDPIECLYKPFNMDGRHYYSYSRDNVHFIALDSNYMDATQLDWLQKDLRGNTSPWKVVYFHHPLYSDARFHGPDTDLRQRVEPLFEQYGVDVVLSGHEHVYERLRPQHGIYYFVLGNAGQLRFHDLRPSKEMAAGFDEDRCFMIAEITGNDFYFQTISRTGKIKDSGTIPRRQ